MAGRRRTLGRPCCSAGHSSRRWLPISSGRMLPPCSTRSGQSVEIAVCNTPKEMAGTACCSRACNYSIAFAQEDRVRIRQPRRNLQVKFNKVLTGKNDFVAYVDAVGDLDGTRCLLE